VIAEDRTLAAPSVGEIRDLLAARVLYDGENETEVVEDVLLAPVYADPAQPHFRHFDSKAILAPFNKTDLHLAAIETQASCLIITGGGEPSPYVIDRAQGESTTVLLTSAETPATLAALGDVWFQSRFRGELKAEAIYRHLEGKVDFANLSRKIGQPA
jgi:BioD-like phosphotransacetylase family protein